MEASEKLLAKCEQEYAQLEAELSLATTKIHQQTEEASKSTDEMQELRRRLTDLQKKLQARDEELHISNTRSDDIQRKHQRLEKQMKFQIQDIDKLEGKKQQLQHRIDKLEGVLGLDSLAYEQTIDNLKTANEKLTKDLERTNSTASASIEELEKQLADTRRERRQIAAEESKGRKEREELEIQVQEYKTTIHEMRQLSSIPINVHGCKSIEDGCVIDENKLLQQSSDMYERRIMGLTKQVARLREQIVRSEVEEENACTTITALKKKLQKRDLELEIATDQQTHLEVQIQKLHVAAVETTITNVASKEEDDELQRSLEQRTTLLIEKEKEISVLNDQVKQLMQEQALRFVPKEHFQSIQDKLVEIERQNAMDKRRAEFEIKDLQQSLQAIKSQSHSQLERALQSHNSDAKNLQALLEKEQTQKLNIQKENGALCSRVEKLVETNNILSTNITKLKAELATQLISSSSRSKQINNLESKLMVIQQASLLKDSKLENRNEQMRQLQVKVNELDRQHVSSVAKSDTMTESFNDLKRKEHITILQITSLKKENLELTHDLEAQVQRAKDAERELRHAGLRDTEIADHKYGTMQKQLRGIEKEKKDLQEFHHSELKKRDNALTAQQKRLTDIEDAYHSLKISHGEVIGTSAALKAELDTVQNTITNATACAATLRNENYELKAQCHEYQREIDVRKTDKALLRVEDHVSYNVNDNNQLQATNTKLRIDLQILEGKFHEKCDELRRAQDAVTSAMQPSLMMKPHVTSLEMELDKAQQKIQHEGEEYRKLEVEYMDFLPRLESVKHDFQEAMSSLKIQHSQATHELRDQLKQAEQDKKLALVRLKSEVYQASKSEQLQNGLLDTINLTREEIQASRQMMVTTQAESTARIQELERELGRQTQKSTAENEVRRLAETECISLHSKLDVLKARQKDLTDKLQVARQKNKGLGKLVTSLQADLSSFQSSRVLERNETLTRESRYTNEIETLKLKENKSQEMIATQDENLLRLGAQVGELVATSKQRDDMQREVAVSTAIHQQEQFTQGMQEVASLRRQLAQDRAMIDNTIQQANLATLKAEQQHATQVTQKIKERKKEIHDERQQHKVHVLAARMEAISAASTVTNTLNFAEIQKSVNEETHVSSPAKAVSPMLTRYLRHPIISNQHDH